MRKKSHQSYVPPLRRDHAALAATILREQVRPIDYSTLSQLCWDRAGWPQRCAANEVYVAENLRQAARDGLCGLAYLGAGLPALVFLRKWVVPTMNFVDRYVIAATDEMRSRAIQEIALRHPYVNWRADGAALCRGYVAQFAVQLDFQRRWPGIVLDPTNQRDHAVPAADDLRFRIGGRTYLVDVATPGAGGGFGGCDKQVAGRRAYFHLLCIVSDDLSTVTVGGCCRHAEFTRGIEAFENARSIENIMFTLNIEAMGLTVGLFVKALGVTREDRNRMLVEQGKRLPHQPRRSSSWDQPELDWAGVK